MRRAFAALAITACALNTMPKSEACREVLGSCADAVSRCCAGSAACEAIAVPACSAMAQQMCTSETGDVDSNQEQACLAALDNYHCSTFETPVFSSDAKACLAMY